VALGIGDDAALVNPSPNFQLVVATDTLVESVHFPVDASAEQIATRALCVNLSDMAAMGATPRWFTLALTLEKADAPWLAGFSRGLAQVADEFALALIGGDTTAGPLTISMTLIGEVPIGEALPRAGANVGDSIYVTGTLGDGAAALKLLTSNDERGLVDSERLLTRFYRPQPQIQVGLKLRGIANACIDISDGLLADLAHLCRASAVSADLKSKRLPIHPDVEESYPQYSLDWALSGGDDYQLCFTVSQDKCTIVNRWIEVGDLNATMIGQIQPATGGNFPVRVDNVTVELNRGFDHFGC
jgi:thiamine-monophosphate kinase